MISALLLAAAAPVQPPLRLATYAYPRYDRAIAMEPLRQMLSAKLRRKVSITLYPSPDALRDAVLDGKVDVAMTNLSSYLGMTKSQSVAAIAVLDVPTATLDGYRGVLLARPGVDPAKPVGLRYVEVLPGSTSGALVQAAWLRRQGIDVAAFKGVRQAGTHEAALAALLAGEADLVSLAEEPWRKLKRDKPDIAAGLIELWRSDPLPPGPVICVRSRTVPCGRIGAWLRSSDGRPAAPALAAGWTETEGAVRFRSVDKQSYRFGR